MKISNLHNRRAALPLWASRWQTLAFATAAPQSLSALIVGHVAKRYQVLDADPEGRWMEADAITKDGRPVELIAVKRSGGSPKASTTDACPCSPK